MVVTQALSFEGRNLLSAFLTEYYVRRRRANGVSRKNTVTMCFAKENLPRRFVTAEGLEAASREDDHTTVLHWVPEPIDHPSGTGIVLNAWILDTKLNDHHDSSSSTATHSFRESTEVSQLQKNSLQQGGLRSHNEPIFQVYDESREQVR